MTTNQKTRSVIGSNDASRVKGMIAETHKASANFSTMLSATAAACLWHFFGHGRPQLLQELYVGLQPEHKEIMRTKMMPAIIDKFGLGGVWNEETQKWKVRPTKFFTFVQNIDANKGETHFQLIDYTADNLSPEQQMQIKQARKNIRDLGPFEGEKALTLVWWTLKQDNRAAEDMTEDKANSKALTFLKSLAKNAFSNGKTQQEITQAARVLGLSTKQIQEISASYQAERPVEDTEDFLSYDTEYTAEAEETAPKASKPKANAEAAHA